MPRATCPSCGDSKARPIDKPYRYTGCGLDYVYLEGVPYVFCKTCNEEVVAIPNEKDVIEKLALFLISQSITIGGPEIRFLRSVVGWTQTELAMSVHVARGTVNRWENERLKYEPSMSIVIRLAFLGGLLRRFQEEHEEALREEVKKQLERLAVGIRNTIDKVSRAKRVCYDAETGKFRKAA